MANGSQTGGRALPAVLTAAAVIGLFVFVALAIKSFDTDDDVRAVGAAVSSGAVQAEVDLQPAPAASPPVGGVATGGGGTASDSEASPSRWSEQSR